MNLVARQQDEAQPDLLECSTAHETARPFRKRVQNFVRAAYPEPAEPRRGGDWKSDPRPRRAEAVKSQPYIRSLRFGKIAQPPVKKAFEVGLHLSTLTGERWLNPVVMLFVCGYYGHVAQLMLDVPESVLRSDERIAMTTALPKMLDITPPTSIEEDRNQLIFAGFGLDIAQRTAQWAASVRQHLSAEMRTWDISNSAFAAFLNTWQRLSREGLDTSRSAIGTCQLITERATYPVSERDRIAVALICDSLMRANGEDNTETNDA